MADDFWALPDDVQRVMDDEDKATSQVRHYAQLLAEAAKPIRNLGDGNGGFVIQEIFNALERAGVYRKPSPNRNRYQKAVIKQSLRTAVLERDLYRCVSCGSHKNLSVDHIHPESAGGTLDLENLQTLCRSCNSKKGVK